MLVSCVAGVDGVGDEDIFFSEKFTIGERNRSVVVVVVGMIWKRVARWWLENELVLSF